LFQQNYTQGLEEEEAEEITEENHLFEEDKHDQLPIFITKEDKFSLDKEDKFSLENHLFEEDKHDQLPIFITKEDKFSLDSFAPSDQELVLSNDDVWAAQTKENQRGY